ncbi:hypothetical protein [Escherichia coli]
MIPDQQQTTDVNKNVTLTVRNIPSDVNARITMQARIAGKSKSDFLNAFLTLSFGDLLGHFIRTSELVTLMDKEIARFAGRELTAQWFESELTPAYHRIYCRLLNLENEEDIKKMMMSNIPYLEQRTHQIRYSHMPFLPRGISLTLAMFCEAAGRDRQTIAGFYDELWFVVDKEKFYREINELRMAKKLEPLPEH